MTNLTNQICTELQTALDAKHPLKQRWEQNERVYRNEPGISTVRLFDNFEPRTVPIMSPRINRIVNTTMNAVAAPTTWVQAVPDDADNEKANALEQGMQTILERANFLRLLRRALTTAALTGVTIVRARLTNLGVRLDHVHPNDFVVSPVHGQDLREASLVGHRFYLPLWKLKERIADNTYPLITKAEDLATADPDADPSGRNPEYDKTSTDTEMVELFELLVRIEGKWNRCVVSRDANKLLLIEPYPYQDPWYLDLRFHDEEGKFWPASSVAQNIVGLCLLQNDMFNLMVAGSMATCANPVVISGGSLGKKLKSINLGQLYETAYDVKVQEIPLHFEPGAMPSVMETIDNQIDAQSGVNQLTIGQEFLQNQTATAATALIAATKENEGAYATFAADFVERLWSFVQSLCTVHRSLVEAIYKNALAKEFFDALEAPVRWQCAARTPSASPSLLLQKLQALLELAQNENSGYDYNRVEDAVVEAMQLPINTQRLKRNA